MRHFLKKMMRHFLFSSVLVVGLAASGFAQQQQQSSDPYAPPPAQPKPPSALPDKSDKNCSGQATKGSGGAWKSSSTCPPASQDQNTPPLTTGQNSGQQAQPKKSTSADNPFPEDVSEKAAAKAKEEDSKSAPAASTGESSSDDSTKNLDLEGDRGSRISNGAGGVVHDPQLSERDVHVGEFYLNREDYKGAYERFKEATQADPANSDAVFYLAEAARHLNHKDEAVQNYQLYLAALPEGAKAKTARKALQGLTDKR